MSENNSQNFTTIASELGILPKQVEATAHLLTEGATVPFIARYRKEATGSLDEVAVIAIRDRLIQLEEFQKRRDAIIKSLEERSILSDELKYKIAHAKTLIELEDLYLPFRPKRKTKASIAKEKGLEDLAEKIFSFAIDSPKQIIDKFINPEKGVKSAEEALEGARDIIAEKINENESIRKQARAYWTKSSLIRSRAIAGKEAEASKYKDYFDWSENASSSPSHRVLALLRGEKEGLLSVQVAPPSEPLVAQLESYLLKKRGPCAEQIKMALHDGYKRLLAPSMESEIRAQLKSKADTEAIKVFSDNIKQLLMAPPLGKLNVLAIDPGFRTGCKIVSLDAQGKLVDHDLIYLHEAEAAKEPEQSSAGKKLLSLCQKYQVGAIAIGNGTAGRETESFVRKLNLKTSEGQKLPIIMVNESGASIYSASEAAREEFPDLDLTIRGAVSIGRRLMDPLAELVKIDPKSIGVGQYQHDVDQTALQKSLDDAVTNCVNLVGVELNTASKQLLTYVSGLGPQLALNIVKYREENGPFKCRTDLKKVTRLGSKAFEQAAGFLRIRGSKHPLDESAVHPESYHLVEAMASDLKIQVKDLVSQDELVARIDPNRYVNEKVGLPTLKDILQELKKPGRDPRSKYETIEFKEGVNKISDLTPNMILDGIVTNVTAFGAFVDVGVHQDGLVHVSELADRFVKNPADFVKVQQRVKVKVMAVDADRKRISLSMKNLS
jgi:uncharacterized protein